MSSPISSRSPGRTTPSSDGSRARAKGGGVSTPSERPRTTTTTRRPGGSGSDGADNARAGAGNQGPPTGTTTPPANDRESDATRARSRRTSAPTPNSDRVDRRIERSGRTVRVRRPDDEPVPARTQRGESLGDVPRDLAWSALDTRGGRRWVPSDDRRWNPDSDDLTQARNAHHSNTPEEMRDALGRDFNWLEGDLRVRDDGELVMAHDADKEDDGLTLDEWLTIGAAGERGLKVDVKEDEALPELLDQLEASDIPDGRLMINVQADQVDEDSVREMRDRFPDAWLALNPRIREGRGYREQDLDEVAALADAAGGRVTFPIRWDIASDDAIEHLERHGRVSIWTADSQGTPDDADEETLELRSRGVSGVIDLGERLSTWQDVQRRFIDIWESDAVRGARDTVGALQDGADWVLDEGGDLLSDGADLAGDLAGGARDLASKAPVIGGLFD